MQKIALLTLHASLLTALCACGGGSDKGATGTPPVTTTPNTVPGAPTLNTATAGNTSATLEFTAPVSTGGTAITGYTASCTYAGLSQTATALASPITVAGLTNFTTYSCAVMATNAVGVGASSTSLSVKPTAPITTTGIAFKAQVWADNWFSLYVGETYIGEDSVPITTEKSFNSETLSFSASYPFDLNFIVKDYKQNDTGLEYIGTANQQIGDGGFIMQVTDTTTSKVVAVSSKDFKCKVIHKAPLNTACVSEASPTPTSCGFTSLAEPTGWKAAGFDTSTWESASTYTAAEVGVKDGYYDINWDASAKLIWTSSLKTDNTLLCKLTVTGFAAATATVSGPPNIASVTAGDTTASVAFSAPTSDGGASISAYTASCTGGGATKTSTGSASPLTVSSLVNNTAYSCTVLASNGKGNSASSAAITVTPKAVVIPSSTFTLTSAAAVSGNLPADYTCDGAGSTPALAWSNAPAGTTEYAVLMSTLPGDGSTKYNWVLYGIPATKSSLVKDSYGVGTLGVGSDGPIVAYQPPCSQGLGIKAYTFTVFALSASPVLSTTTAISGTALLAAISSTTLGTTTLTLNYNRTATAPGLGVNCGYVTSSTKASTTGNASVGCDSSYAYIAADGLATHAMMNGITASNLQVPIGQKFFGSNAWKIPLSPAIAASTTTATDGPIGVAINGVPIFNPCKQGGCANGDTKVLGELDSCNGHAGRADDYHYHAAPTCMMAGKTSTYWDTHPIGWALDGFAIFGYNNHDGSVATRDSICGGNTTTVSNAPAGYSYHVTDSSPYVLSCFRGTPSPDLAGQGAKYTPVRQPPVTPFPVSGMTLSKDATDGYQVLQFTSAQSFTATETGSDSYANAPGTYKIRYKAVTGTALSTLLALSANSGKSACWNFQFVNSGGTTTQPSVSYCR